MPNFLSTSCPLPVGSIRSNIQHIWNSNFRQKLINMQHNFSTQPSHQMADASQMYPPVVTRDNKLVLVIFIQTLVGFGHLLTFVFVTCFKIFSERKDGRMKQTILKRAAGNRGLQVSCPGLESLCAKHTTTLKTSVDELLKISKEIVQWHRLEAICEQHTLALADSTKRIAKLQEEIIKLRRLEALCEEQTLALRESARDLSKIRKETAQLDRDASEMRNNIQAIEIKITSEAYIHIAEETRIVTITSPQKDHSLVCEDLAERYLLNSSVAPDPGGSNACPQQDASLSCEDTVEECLPNGTLLPHPAESNASSQQNDSLTCEDTVEECLPNARVLPYPARLNGSSQRDDNLVYEESAKQCFSNSRASLTSDICLRTSEERRIPAVQHD